MSTRPRAVLVAIGLAVLPASVHACSVCGGGNPANRFAFFMSTIVLSLLPLVMIAGGVWWVRSRLKGVLAEEFMDRDQPKRVATPAPPLPTEVAARTT